MESQKFTYEYPHPAVATDCVVFGFDGYDMRILLIERGIEPYKGCWAFPGGFMRMDETAEQCTIRELREETGLNIDQVTQIGAFSGINRDPRERVISIAFYALAKKTEVQGGDDAALAKWIPINELPQLAFDHDYILRKAMQKIKEDMHFEPIGFELLDKEFTMPELQRLYEAILGIRFDRRNFYKKMMQTGILKDAEPKSKPEQSNMFFGNRNEMRSMSIDALFGNQAKPKATTAYIASDDSDIEIPHRRKNTKFTFDKEKYDKFKENHNFRLEF